MNGSEIRLFLYGTHGNAMDKVLLQPGVYAQYRHGGEHDDRRLQGFGKTGRREAFLGSHLYTVNIVQNVVQKKLQGLIILIVHIHQGIRISVPASHRIEQGEGSEHRL